MRQSFRKKPAGTCYSIALLRHHHGLRNINEPPSCQTGLYSWHVESLIKNRNDPVRSENGDHLIEATHPLGTLHEHWLNKNGSDDGDSMLLLNQSIDPELENNLTLSILSYDDESSETDDDSYDFNNAIDCQHDVMENEVDQIYTSKKNRIYNPNLSIPINTC